MSLLQFFKTMQTLDVSGDPMCIPGSRPCSTHGATRGKGHGVRQRGATGGAHWAQTTQSTTRVIRGRQEGTNGYISIRRNIYPTADHFYYTLYVLCVNSIFPECRVKRQSNPCWLDHNHMWPALALVWFLSTGSSFMSMSTAFKKLQASNLQSL